jgi:hypothetical protein
MKNDCVKIGDTHRNQSPKMGGSESQGHVIIIILHGYFALLEASGELAVGYLYSMHKSLSIASNLEYHCSSRLEMERT